MGAMGAGQPLPGTKLSKGGPRAPPAETPPGKNLCPKRSSRAQPEYFGKWVFSSFLGRFVYADPMPCFDAAARIGGVTSGLVLFCPLAQGPPPWLRGRA